MARFFLPKISFILTVLLFGFVATVYALKPEPVSKQQTSARLANVPVYRVVADTAELPEGHVATGPAKVLVADAGEAQGAAYGTDALRDESSNPVLESAQPAGPANPAIAQEPVAPASLGLSPKPEGQGGGLPSSPPVSASASSVEIEELKDLGMANISAGGIWYTLQSAYVPASDKNTLSRRLMELSEALGNREGVFVYQTNRSEGVFFGVCVNRFASAAQAKNFKKTLDKKLGYPTQIRSQKGLQTEVGF